MTHNSSRGQHLARQFSNANDALIALLEQATPEQLRSRTLDDGELRSVGVIAHHVATAHPRIAQRVEAFARGLPVPDAPSMTTAQVIEQRQIGHVLQHLATVRTVCSA